jgi:hypothetical protein
MIANKTRKKTLVLHHRECRSIFSKARGLMFTCPIKNFGLVFFFGKETIVSLHMFFVFYSIDVLFLDKKGKIVDMKEKFKPFTVYIPEKPAQNSL